jgi:hypothetical protein
MSRTKTVLKISLTPEEQEALLFALDLVGRLAFGDVTSLYYGLASLLCQTFPPTPNKELRLLLEKMQNDILATASPAKKIIEDVFALYLKVNGAQLEILPKKRGPKSAEIPPERIVVFVPRVDSTPLEEDPDKDASG